MSGADYEVVWHGALMSPDGVKGGLLCARTERRDPRWDRVGPDSAWLNMRPRAGRPKTKPKAGGLCKAKYCRRPGTIEGRCEWHAGLAVTSWARKRRGRR